MKTCFLQTKMPFGRKIKQIIPNKQSKGVFSVKKTQRTRFENNLIFNSNIVCRKYQAAASIQKLLKPSPCVAVTSS